MFFLLGEFTEHIASIKFLSSKALDFFIKVYVTYNALEIFQLFFLKIPFLADSLSLSFPSEISITHMSKFAKGP